MSNDTSLAFDRTSRLINLAARRNRVNSRTALHSVARQAQVAPGTLENIQRNRKKTIPAWLRDRLGVLLVKELQHEIQTLEAELQLARLAASHPLDSQVEEAEEALAKAKEILSGR